MKKSILVLLLFCWPFLNGLTQINNTSIKFAKTIHDFGEINEINGEVSCTFSFINNENSNLIIEDIIASCGCTTSDWTKEPIKPYERGLISVAFDPTKISGEFNRSITVIFREHPQAIELFIKGKVEPKQRSIEEEFPIVMGGIRFENMNINFMEITNEKVITKTIAVYNEMYKSAIWSKEIEAPQHITVKFLPEVIPSKFFGSIEITYDPRDIKLFGYKGDKLQLETNEWFNSSKNLRVIAFLEEYFHPLSEEEQSEAPKLLIKESVHDFGSVKEGIIVSHDFQITNIGKQYLNIRMTRASCGCTVSKIENKNLKPGESGSVKVTFNTEGKHDNQSEIIFVHSNDPLNPTQKMTIKARVVN